VFDNLQSIVNVRLARGSDVGTCEALLNDIGCIILTLVDRRDVSALRARL
jgi:hypothetical protein